MIIFGFRSFVKTLAMLTMVCHRCSNPAAHRLVQRSRWFTLFFIPLIPVGFSRFTTCTFCGATYKVSKEDAQRMVAGATAGAPPAAPVTPAQPGAPAQPYPPQP
jgi:zinc-ribbon family